MRTRQSIISFAQSEKVKSGLIWCTQCVQTAENLGSVEQQGANRILQSLIAMLINEVHLAMQASGEPVWLEVDKVLNNARVMVDSGVPQEAVFHFTQGLTQVNRIGQKAMGDLIEKGLLD